MLPLNVRDGLDEFKPLTSELINSEIRNGSNLRTLISMAKQLGAPGDFTLERDLEDKMAKKIRPWLHYNRESLELAAEAWDYLGVGIREKIAEQVADASATFRSNKYTQEHADDIDTIFGERIQRSRLKLVNTMIEMQ